MGSFLPWTSNGSLHVGIYGQYLEGIDPMVMCMRSAMFNLVMGVIVLAVVYFINKAGSKTGAETPAEPSPFSKSAEEHHAHHSLLYWSLTGSVHHQTSLLRMQYANG